MRGWHTFLILAGLLIAYIFLINLVANIIVQYASVSSIGEGGFVTYGGGSNVNLGMSDSVSVSVVRPRFYGKIFESFGLIRVSYIYLFNFLKLPLHAGKVNFIYFHIAMISLLFILLIVLTALER